MGRNLETCSFAEYVSTQNENWDSNATEMDGYWMDIQWMAGCMNMGKLPLALPQILRLP